MSDWFVEFEKVGALHRKGHFVYTSGRHGTDYFNKDALFPHVDLISRACEELARRFGNSSIECVVAPALGGIILSQWVAHHLSRLGGRPVLALYAEKTERGLELRRGYAQLAKGAKCLLLEDVITTGGSIAKVRDAVRSVGGEVLGLGALCMRSDLEAANLGVPRLEVLVRLILPTWEKGDCPACRAGLPIRQDLGKGASS